LVIPIKAQYVNPQIELVFLAKQQIYITGSLGCASRCESWGSQGGERCFLPEDGGSMFIRNVGIYL
jgi:hypothetical protein